MGKIVKSDKPQGWSGTTEDRQGKEGGKWLSWGDCGPARLPTQEYKDGLDKVDFSKGKPEKRGYRLKINGKYVDE